MSEVPLGSIEASIEHKTDVQQLKVKKESSQNVPVKNQLEDLQVKEKFKTIDEHENSAGKFPEDSVGEKATPDPSKHLANFLSLDSSLSRSNISDSVSQVASQPKKVVPTQMGPKHKQSEKFIDLKTAKVQRIDEGSVEVIGDGELSFEPK